MFWIVLKLESLLAFFNSCRATKGSSDTLLALRFPAGRIAFERLSIFYRLTNSHYMSVTTSTVVSHLSLARFLRTSMAWVAFCLTTVRAVVTRSIAALSTAVHHQVLNASEALSFVMTDFLADVTAF